MARILPSLLLLALATAPLAAGAWVEAPAPATAPPRVDACVPTCHVHMTNVGLVFFYDPPVVTASPGSVIEFHAHGAAHSAISGLLTESEPAEGAAPAALRLQAFDTGFVPDGASASVTLGGAGSYAYYCGVALHRVLGMHGEIVVV